MLVRAAETQFHLGLGRGREPHEPVLHLAWHRRLRDEGLAEVIRSESEPRPTAVIALALDPLVDEALQALSRRIATRYANRSCPIAYGFGDASASFGQTTGELTDPDAAFTCATFVLAMLRSVGIQMIDTARWRAPTEEDLQWQREIATALLEWIGERIHGDLPRAKERIDRDIGARRYRPTDVAGAALFGPDTWPVGAEDVDPRANMLESRLPWSGATS
jgi:hypothetical protein